MLFLLSPYWRVFTSRSCYNMAMPSEDFLRTILTNLVDFPTDIKIDKTSDEMGVLLSVRVAQEDMGKVIGRQGMTAKAIKHIINCHGFTQRAKVSVKFYDPITS